LAINPFLGIWIAMQINDSHFLNPFIY